MNAPEGCNFIPEERKFFFFPSTKDIKLDEAINSVVRLILALLYLGVVAKSK